MIAFVCCAVYLFRLTDKEKVIMVSLQERDLMEIVLMDQEGCLVPVNVEMPFVMDEPSSLIWAVEYMRDTHSYEGLKGFLNGNASINSVKQDGDVASIDINKSFFGVDKRQNRKFAEALVSIIRANTSIGDIILTEEGMLLETIPYTSIAVKDMIYSLPINVFESAGTLHDTIPFTKYQSQYISNRNLLVPTTYYVKGERTLPYVMEMFGKSLLNEGLFEKLGKLYHSFSINKQLLKLDVSNLLCFEEQVIDEQILNRLLLTLFDNLPIKTIELTLEGEPYLYEKRIKGIQRKDLVYNLFKF